MVFLPWTEEPGGLQSMRLRRVGHVQEDVLEKEMATHSSVLAWKIPSREEPGYGLHTTVHGVAKSRTQLSDFTFTFTFRRRGIIGEKMKSESIRFLKFLHYEKIRIMQKKIHLERY